MIEGTTGAGMAGRTRVMAVRRLSIAVLAGSLLLSACSKDPSPAADPDAAAKAELRNALVAGKTFYTDGTTYSGFDSTEGSSIEPSLTWVDDGPASLGVVSIDLASGAQVVLSTRSASGQTFCLADDAASGGTSGTVDAQGATSTSDCTGDDWAA
jgi:hypothetical protein